MSRPREASLRVAWITVVLALGSSALYALAVTLARRGVLPFSMEPSGFAVASWQGTLLWLVLRNFGPALSGLAAVALVRGRAAVGEIGRGLLRWRVRPRLLLWAWFGLALGAASVATGLAVGAQRFDAAGLAPLRIVPLFVLMALFDGPLGEEVGWRGVLLPALLERTGPLAASLIVGIAWDVWHVPLYAVDGKMAGVGENLFFLFTSVALSVIFTWFFLESRGSTLLIVYLHDATNFAIFLRRKFFPAVGDSQLPLLVWVVGLLVVTLLAARALRRGAGATRAA